MNKIKITDTTKAYYDKMRNKNEYFKMSNDEFIVFLLTLLEKIDAQN